MSNRGQESTVPPDEIDDLRAIIEGTATSTGQEFFYSLVQHLAHALHVRYAFVAEFAGDLRSRTLAYWKVDRIADNFEWDLVGTPCEDVIRGGLCHYPTGVATRFPADEALARMHVESYLGVPLKSGSNQTLGHLAVFDDQPMNAEPRRLSIFRIFASRAAAELERLRMEKLVLDSEQRYRYLYEQAPIAYIEEGLDSTFISANGAAMQLLGLKPEDVPGTRGVSLLAPSEETQQRVRAALDAMKSEGKQFAGVELELRRKDDGRPIWVQWWSKPDPDGKHTRTMLVDITQRVLMEREKARLQQQNLYLREEIQSTHNFQEIVGRSAKLTSVLNDVKRVATTDASVLITGETGTGKELIARAIHSASQRADKALIKVNCAALPTGLVESELFGHERGAFSGAIVRRVGRFELAHGGTIFLDEIGEVPLEVQVKLLRILQEREFERVGGNTSIKCDVRIIAATNRDLLKCVPEGTFREDLYYRLNVFPLHLPPLRERADDIPLLAQFLVTKFATRVGRRIENISTESLRKLLAYAWPGNIRELENVLERAVILSNGGTLEIGALLDAHPASPQPSNAQVATGLEAMERAHILAVLKQTDWVIEGERGAAKVLQIHPNTLRSRLKKLGISRGNTHEGS